MKDEHGIKDLGTTVILIRRTWDYNCAAKPFSVISPQSYPEPKSHQPAQLAADQLLERLISVRSIALQTLPIA